MSSGKPELVTEEIEKIGQTLPEGIRSAYFVIYYKGVPCFIRIGIF